MPLANAHKDTDQDIPTSRRSYLPIAIATLIVLAFVGFATTFLNQFSWDDDEAVQLLTAWAAHQGYRLYDQVWLGYPPGYIYLLRIAIAVGGPSLVAGRVVTLVCSALALSAVFFTSRHFAGDWCAVAAVALLVSFTHYLVMSAAIMIEIPAMALATASVWVALEFIRRQRTGLIALSGVLLSAGLFLKPTVVAAVPAAMVALSMADGSRKAKYIRLGLWLGGLASVFVAGMAFVYLPGFVRQVGLTYFESESAVTVEWARHLHAVLEYFALDKYGVSHLGFVAFAIIGIVSVERVDRRDWMVVMVWFLATVLVLVTHAPLYRHHLVQLLFPMSVLGGAGFARLLRTFRVGRGSWRLATTMLLVSVSGVFLWELYGAMHVSATDLSEIESDHLQKAQEAVSILRSVTRSDDWIITDAQVLAVRAGRAVPPELTDTSRRRIRTGQLTAKQVIDLTDKYAPAAIVFWEEKLEPSDRPDAGVTPDSLDPSFAQWVNCTYDLYQQWGDRFRIYTKAQVVEPDALCPVARELHPGLSLVGYSAAPDELVLVWEASERVDEDLVVHIEGIDADGTVSHRIESIPREGLCPTSTWPIHQRVVDRYSLDSEAAHVPAKTGSWRVSLNLDQEVSLALDLGYRCSVDVVVP